MDKKENNINKKNLKNSSIKIEYRENAPKKQVIWDDKKIEEHELEKKLHPKMKIIEPKTPYMGTVN
jgi:hypothetical protein